MNKNEFFREATSRICGNLEIEEALVSSLNFLRQEMPVDRMFLQFFEDGLNAMRTVAIATPGKGMTVDLLTSHIEGLTLLHDDHDFDPMASHFSLKTAIPR